jgi:hypothetical protein
MSDFAALFQNSEPGPDPVAAQETPTPAWFGPPDDELGACVPASLVIGRSDNGVIALQSITAYSTGALLNLIAVARGLSNSKANVLFHDQHNPGSEDGIPDGYIRLGVEYPDGTRVSNLGDRRRIGQNDDEPDSPVLVQRGGGSSSGGGGRVSMNATHWLWPLPPAAPLRLFVEWPALGIALSNATLDGHTIAIAAAQTQQLWDTTSPPRAADRRPPST